MSEQDEWLKRLPPICGLLMRTLYPTQSGNQPPPRPLMATVCCLEPDHDGECKDAMVRRTDGLGRQGSQ